MRHACSGHVQPLRYVFGSDPRAAHPPRRYVTPRQRRSRHDGHRCCLRHRCRLGHRPAHGAVAVVVAAARSRGSAEARMGPGGRADGGRTPSAPSAAAPRRPGAADRRGCRGRRRDPDRPHGLMDADARETATDGARGLGDDVGTGTGTGTGTGGGLDRAEQQPAARPASAATRAVRRRAHGSARHGDGALGVRFLHAARRIHRAPRDAACAGGAAARGLAGARGGRSGPAGPEAGARRGDAGGAPRHAAPDPGRRGVALAGP
ncbi:hypothetical protein CAUPRSCDRAFT_11125 [Caulochytrium protostelioides]|uniref:Uncharacterized protein n=1 Tax=Caulochytrium protostelioides TaxID=1555241 RepID=A0A4P9WXW6_9FUNG|nr:hypothetical protein CAUPRSCDRAFT_11125 [Caulochytrium protostelioides]